jgi:ATP-dependent Clp protease ATP-binding subunit ClpX
MQTPDKRSGQEKVDAVLVDEESIIGSGSNNVQGCGAKILRGDGALDRYITEANVRHIWWRNEVLHSEIVSFC